MNTSRTRSLLAVVGPGLLVAATGVGAGDLATAAFTGSHLGAAVLWAVVVGAIFKYALTEGLARWQLATGTTLLEGAVRKLGLSVAVVFLLYLLPWSFLVGSALMSACGATAHAALPIFADATTAKIVFGMAHSVLGVVLVLVGGFRLFEKVMSLCIGLMFVTVLVTAGCLWPGTAVVLRGLFVPAVETLHGESLSWTVALIGGVGGTVTVLCYGYWIREKDRRGAGDVAVCRLDLAVGYGMTAVFGIAMVIIGSTVNVEGTGATLIVDLAASLQEPLGAIGKWMFLLGAWGAVFSSLLGVWQAIPYLFADFCLQVSRRSQRPGDVETGRDAAVDTRSLPYRGYLFGIATVPALGLFASFRDVQKVYAVVGAFFIPLLAIALLVLNGRAEWVGARLRSGWATVVVLVAALAFFTWVLWGKLVG